MLALARHTLNANTGLVTLYDLPLSYREDASLCYVLTPYAKREVGVVWRDLPQVLSPVMIE